MTRTSQATALWTLTLLTGIQATAVMGQEPVPVNVTYSGVQSYGRAITPWADSLRGAAALNHGRADLVRARGQYIKDYQEALTRSLANKRDYNGLRLQEIETSKNIRKQNEAERDDQQIARAMTRFVYDPAISTIRSGAALNFIVHDLHVDLNSYLLHNETLSPLDLQALRFEMADGFSIDSVTSVVDGSSRILWTDAMLHPAYTGRRQAAEHILADAITAVRSGADTEHLLTELDTILDGFNDRLMISMGSAHYTATRKFSRDLTQHVAHLGDGSIRVVTFKPQNVEELVRHMQTNKLNLTTTDTRGTQTYVRIHTLLAKHINATLSGELAAR